MGTAWAMSGNQGAATDGAGAMMSFLPMLVVMVIVMYFFIIRPQQKRQKEASNMMNSLKKGDKVSTAGGIIGTIVGIDDKVIVLKIAENTKVEFKKSAIIEKVGSGDAA